MRNTRKTKLRVTKARIRRGRKTQLYHCVTIPRHGSGRTRRFFAFTPEGKREAETFLHLARQQQANYGTAAFSISDRLRAEAVECSARLAEEGHTLTAATDFFLSHVRVQKRSISVADAKEQLIASRKSAGRSERYCQDLRLRLTRFANDFDSAAIGAITAAQINAWLAGLRVSAGTRNTFRRDLRTLFSFCEKHGYCQTNEAKKTERATAVDKPVEILTVEHANALLNASDEDILPYVAISLFAGVRAAEMQKLDWSEVDLESGHIEVTATKSKTKKRRLIPIAENLATWIRPLARVRGGVAPAQLRRRFDEVKKRAGFERWPQNAMRHSYGSYRLAQCHDAARVSLEMGNSPQMMFEHYRELVKPERAERYWKILPTKAEDKVVNFERSAA